MEVRKIVGWNVRRFRVGQGLTIEELAGHSEADASYIGRIERAEVNVSVDVLERISKALKVRVMELFMEPLPGTAKPAPLSPGRRPSRPNKR